MTETKFTPAPWVYAPDYDENDGDIILNSGYEKPVSIVFKSDLQDAVQYPREEVVANAHLIAAAPDLYEALSSVEWQIINTYPDICEMDESHDDGIMLSVKDMRAVLAALAKARGEVSQ